MQRRYVHELVSEDREKAVISGPKAAIATAIAAQALDGEVRSALPAQQREEIPGRKRRTLGIPGVGRLTDRSASLLLRTCSKGWDSLK
jgi:hypothetical protein